MIAAILTLTLLTQTPERPPLNYFLVSQADYMLLPADPAPAPKEAAPAEDAPTPQKAAQEPEVQEAAAEPEDAPEVKEAVYEPSPDWYKVNKPDWYATEWVWGVKDPQGKIDWEPEAQPDAWARNGQKQPVWTQSDAYGQAYVHYDKRVLTKFVAGQRRKWRAERQTATQPAIQTYQPPQLFQGYWSMGSSCGPAGCN